MRFVKRCLCLVHMKIFSAWTHGCTQAHKQTHAKEIPVFLRYLSRKREVKYGKSSRETLWSQYQIFTPAAHSVTFKYLWFFLPVSSSLISTSVVFRSSRTSAGIPPQFFKAILLSSLALPYTRFLRAPQALRCTSVIRWSNKSTSSWMPPCRRIWRWTEEAIRGNSQTIELHLGQFPPTICLLVRIHSVQYRKILACFFSTTENNTFDAVVGEKVTLSCKY